MKIGSPYFLSEMIMYFVQVTFLPTHLKKNWIRKNLDCMNSKEGPKKHHSEILRIKQLNILALKIMRKSNKCKMVF